ncbi:MAG: hypothetical protein GY697_25055 [Desulfobacterales bacterium]|nr:hypothetical protein [Desulfobacterales bacterium]
MDKRPPAGSQDKKGHSRIELYGSGFFFARVSCFPLETRMSKKLQALGYREIAFCGDTVLGKKELVIRGPEFHYSTATGHREDQMKTVTRVHARVAVIIICILEAACRCQRVLSWPVGPKGAKRGPHKLFV